MSRPLREIVIVGGGAAGWLTAGVLAAEHRARDGTGPRICVVESPGVPVIGVGEGTWPSMRDTLRRMGVAETAFLLACEAAFKQGSRFDGWVDGTGGDHYYHPFAAPLGLGEVNPVPAWLALDPPRPFAGAVSFQPALCDAGRAPKQASTPEFAAVANYGYHLDAHRFGEFLRRHCTGQLGVTHVPAHVEGVRAGADGDIAGLETREHGFIGGDLFVDCTGFAALLLDGHFRVPWVDLGDQLFCDAALAVQVPHARPDAPVTPYTRATAQPAGWIWDIALPGRRGVGYVHSSSHADPDEAASCLAAYLRADPLAGAPTEAPRRIGFRPGHRERFWHRNCVAVGLAAGFVEPLEASALALVELSARMLAEDLPPTRELAEVAAQRFNRRFRLRWERVADFLKLHYALSRRDDSGFWRAHRDPASWSPRLRELLELWRHRPPGRADFPEAEELFPAASHQYVLYGMGFRPGPSHARRLDDPAAAQRCFDEAAATARRFLSGLPDHRALLEQLRTRGLPRG